MCQSAQRDYGGRSDAPAAARGFGHAMVIAALTPKGWPLADDAAVVISDLVSEAVESGASTVQVRVTIHWDNIDIEVVHDEGAALGRTRPDDEVATMRRLVLSGLTSEITVKPTDRGLTLRRALMRCDPAFTPKVACDFRPGRRTARR